MSKQNTTPSGRSPDWRQAFRQHSLDIHPDLGVDGSACVSEAPERHWLLQEPHLRSIPQSIAVELRELGRWTGAFADVDNAALLQVAIARVGMAGTARPSTALEHATVVVRIVARGLREIVRLQGEIAGAKAAARPRRA